MNAKASIARHPIHPMLMPLPIGLWIFSFVCDLIAIRAGYRVWSTIAFYSMGTGIVGGLAAALPGFLDLYFLESWSIKKLGLWHMGINLAVVALYLLNLSWRFNTPLKTGHLALSGVALLLLAVSGWLGGEMVYVHGAGVQRVPEE